MNNEDFRLQISPRMLELLSKDLYSNLYFVFAELIANAYDADAENVYIFIDETEIRIEDDGSGMTENELKDEYLWVGKESRGLSSTNDNKSKKKKRLKMGRKGIGKLAALSISNGFKLITISNSNLEKIGLFIPNKIQDENEKLKILTENECNFLKVKNHGTAVIMSSPKIVIPKSIKTVLNNLGKIFPNGMDDFKIHIIMNGKEERLNSSEKEIAKNLCSFISIGNEKKALEKYLDKDELVQKKHWDCIKKKVKVQNEFGKLIEIDLKIYGWIGTYKTIRKKSKELQEFSVNYLAIFSHNKMGLRNVLPIVSQNALYENYIVGNLYIDAFEDSNLPDMATTNRQGYNENDPRWEAAVLEIKKLTIEILKMHKQFQKSASNKSEINRLNMLKEQENKLSKDIEIATNEFINNLSAHISDDITLDELNNIIYNEFNKIKPILGFKNKNIDADKKKILISHTSADLDVSEIIYDMLIFNNVPKKVIIYSSSSDIEANLPENVDIYEYLRDFFVKSSSDKMIFVLFVLSHNVFNDDPNRKNLSSWGAMMEIGASWITRKDHLIFNINDFKPQTPLDAYKKWTNIKVDDDDHNDKKIIKITKSFANSFCQKIILTCESCGYKPKSFDKNLDKLKELVEIE